MSKFSIGDRVRAITTSNYWAVGDEGVIIRLSGHVYFVVFENAGCCYVDDNDIQLLQEPLEDNTVIATPTHRVDNKQLTEGTIETLMAIVGSMNTKKVALEDEIDSLLVTVGYLRKKLDGELL